MDAVPDEFAFGGSVRSLGLDVFESCGTPVQNLVRSVRFQIG